MTNKASEAAGIGEAAAADRDALRANGLFLAVRTMEATATGRARARCGSR